MTTSTRRYYRQARPDGLWYGASKATDREGGFAIKREDAAEQFAHSLGLAVGAVECIDLDGGDPDPRPPGGRAPEPDVTPGVAPSETPEEGLTSAEIARLRELLAG